MLTCISFGVFSTRTAHNKGPSYHEIYFPFGNLEDELAQFIYMCKREFYFQL